MVNVALSFVRRLIALDLKVTVVCKNFVRVKLYGPGGCTSGEVRSRWGAPDAAGLNLQSALTKLAEAELIQVRGIPPRSTYRFKHALVRDAAYEALLKARRRELHRKIAQTINESFIETKGGKAAEARNAFPEALESYRQALSLFNLLPESPARDGGELELRQSIVWMLYVTKSHASPEVIDATGQAAALAEKSGNLKQLVIWVMSRGLSTLLAGDLRSAGALADQALELAIRDGDPANLGVVPVLQIMVRYWRGDLDGADEHFTAGLHFFGNGDFRQFPGSAVAAFGFASLNACTLGRIDIARQRELCRRDRRRMTVRRRFSLNAKFTDARN